MLSLIDKVRSMVWRENYLNHFNSLISKRRLKYNLNYYDFMVEDVEIRKPIDVDDENELVKMNVYIDNR